MATITATLDERWAYKSCGGQNELLIEDTLEIIENKQSIAEQSGEE